MSCLAIANNNLPSLSFFSCSFLCQVFGGAGVSNDFPLARTLVGLRSLRIADGPDAVHKRTVALMQIKKAKARLRQSKL